MRFVRQRRPIANNITLTLRWRHNGCDSVSNHQPQHCLLNRLFRRRSKKTAKLRVTGFCAGNSPGPVNSPHKWSVTRKLFPFDDVITQLSCKEYVYLISDRCPFTRGKCKTCGNYQGQRQAVISQLLWGVITCPCPWYLYTSPQLFPAQNGKPFANSSF